MASKFVPNTADLEDDDASQQVSISPLTGFSMSEAGPEIASLQISLSENVSKSSITGFDSSIIEAGPEIATESRSWRAMSPQSPIQAPRQETNKEGGPQITSNSIFQYPGISRFDTTSESSAFVNVIATCPLNIEEQVIKQSNKPESLKDKLRNRNRNQLSKSHLQQSRNTTDNTNLIPTRPVYSNLVASNVNDFHVKQLKSGVISLFSSDISSVTPPTTTSRLLMSTEPITGRGSGVSSIAVSREKKSTRINMELGVDDNHKQYEDIIIEKFGDLLLQYVHHMHSESFFQDVEHECRRHRISLPAEDDTFVLHMKQACKILWQAVKSIEDDFKNFSWFPDGEMRKRLIAFKTLPASEIQIHTKIVTALRNKLRAFSQEYQLRNSEGQKQEKTHVLALITEHVTCCVEQSLAKIGNRYLDPEIILKEIDEECYKEVEKAFVSAFGSRHLQWKAFYTIEIKLNVASSKGIARIRQKLDENRILLERQLDDAGKTAVEIYNVSMSESVIESFDELTTIELTIYDQVMESYKMLVQEITKNQSKMLNESKLRIFTKALVDAANISRRNIRTRIKANEDARKANMNMNRRAREQRSHQGTSKITANAGLTSKVTSKKNNTKQNEQTTRNSSTSWCAIANIGIHKSSCTLFDTVTATNGEKLEKANEDWTGFYGIEPHKPFLKRMLDQPVQTYYLGFCGKERVGWTIIDFIIVLFKGMKAYLISKGRNINYCVLVLPQCMNIIQQECFRRGAEIAGFTRVDILTNTHVLALKFFLDLRFSTPNVITVHVSDNIIESALFSKTDESMQCKAVAGDLFRTDKDRIFNFLWKKLLPSSRIAEIFAPMLDLLQRENLVQTTYLVFFGDISGWEQTWEHQFRWFERTTMDADSIMIGAGMFAQMVLQRNHTELIKGVLDETTKQEAQKSNKVVLSGPIPEPTEFVLKS